MANTITMLLTAEERRTLYEPPVLNDAERNECFTFTEPEIKALKSFREVDSAVYFAISLAFFKFKYTLIRFRYREVTSERQHVMQRYFPNKSVPRRFPIDKDIIARIENKVLAVTGFSRFREKNAKPVLVTLQSQASLYPRQRQLVKTLLNLLIKENIALPSITTLQNCVTQVWNNELSRVIKAYYRNTLRAQRKEILALLEKTDDQHRIVSIRKDMKQFNTTDIRSELDKHKQLKNVFIIAKNILPKLQLPTATIEYYAQLINYYNGARLKQLNTDTVQLYL
jgi:hypothetical protein